VNFTANDYGTGLLLAAGIVLALLGRARGLAVDTIEASLALTATLFQSEDVAALGALGAVPDRVGGDGHRDGHGLRGPSVWCRLYAATDGWVTVCCVTGAQRAGLARALGLGLVDGVDRVDVGAVEDAVASFGVDDLVARLRAEGVPVARSVHPSAVPDDPQVVARGLLRQVRHPAAGRFVQVGIPLSLSEDEPAVKGPAPTPAPVRRRVKPTTERAAERTGAVR
jgi:crotonobetainyl-CoA:carnitine CoA-transferase CaiB-like acyl-CoA transferase